MKKSWKPFMAGVLAALAFVLGGYLYMGDKTGQQAGSQQAAVSPGAVTIQALPPLLTLGGFEVPFEGKTEMRQVLAARLAGEVVIVNFRASGENAKRSEVKIVWEDGSVETVPPGTVNKRFAPEKRAKQISILGYCMHERRVFKDSPRKGTLTWEIRYAPQEN